MISAVISFVLRLVLLAASVILVLSLMAVALVTLLGVVLWSLIRGRKPTIDLSGMKRARGHFHKPRGAAPRHMGDVVDVEAREVPNAPQARLEP